MRCRHFLSLAATALMALAWTGPLARADVIIFKDGFMVQGKVKQQGVFDVDAPSGQGLWIPKGTFVLDTGASRVYFSHVQVEDVIRKDLTDEGDLVKLESRIGRFNSLPIYPLVDITGVTPWNDKWERTFRMVAPFGPLALKQRLTFLTPQFARVDAFNYIWSAYYQTREFSPQTIHDLLAWHADTRRKKGETDSSRRFRVYRFYLQGGWYDQAEEELKGIAKDFPGDKEKVEAAKQHLQTLKTFQLYEDIQLARQAGRHQWVQKQLAAFPREAADEKQQAGIRALKAEYTAANENLDNARRLLKELSRRVSPTPQRKLVAEATSAILEELTYENVGRLEAFSSLALQAERDQKQDRKPANDPAQLLALAITGWLQGKDSAEAKVVVAQRLWRGREFVLKYLNTADETDRAALLKDYLKTESVAIDEMTQMVGFLPAPQPYKEKFTTEPMHVQTDLPWGRKKGTPYVLQLPPEYHPGRAYPVLIALHPGNEKPFTIVECLASEAAKHGYILAAPQWSKLLEPAYTFSAEEHEAVLNVLGDLRRRFQVDSDRVFLTGLKEGANMAFDVGLAHPDLFAGVLPVSGWPKLFAERYAANAQNLPFYVVDGDRTGDVAKQTQGQFKVWVPLGYAALYVSYKGRGLEWFDAEVPVMFDWMDHKKGEHKRAKGYPNLGKLAGSVSQEYQTMRQTDNHFYWLSTDAIREGNIADPAKWRASVFAATLQGHISEGNLININARSLKQLTVWLVREMIDFSKPVTIRVNNRTMWNGTRVRSSLGAMLEDLFQRGDRQRLFWARVDFDRP